jgi:hypothetical protein
MHPETLSQLAAAHVDDMRRQATAARQHRPVGGGRPGPTPPPRARRGSNALAAAGCRPQFPGLAIQHA